MSLDPKDIRKYIVQIYGIGMGMGIGGVVLINTGVKVEKTEIKINLSELGTEVTTTSIGVILICLSIFLLIVPVLRIGKIDLIEKLKQIKVSRV